MPIKCVVGGKSKTLVFEVFPRLNQNFCWLSVTELCKALHFPADILIVVHMENNNFKNCQTGSHLLKTEHQQITLLGKPFIFFQLVADFFYKRCLCLYFYRLKKEQFRGILYIAHLLSLSVTFVCLDFDKIECSLEAKFCYMVLHFHLIRCNRRTVGVKKPGYQLSFISLIFYSSSCK